MFCTLIPNLGLNGNKNRSSGELRRIKSEIHNQIDLERANKSQFGAPLFENSLAPDKRSSPYIEAIVHA